MGTVLQEVETSVAFRELVRSKEATCFLCKWIKHDLETNGKLTGWPLDSFNKPGFPIDAKLIHVILELGFEPPKEEPETNDDLASVVVHLLETVQESN